MQNTENQRAALALIGTLNDLANNRPHNAEGPIEFITRSGQHRALSFKPAVSGKQRASGRELSSSDNLAAAVVNDHPLVTRQ